LKPPVFELEEERLEAEIAKRGAKRVLLQLPEGLKPQGPRLASLVEDAGALAIVSADPCYGACDLAIHEAEALGADLLIHFGHSPTSKKLGSIPVVYIEAKAELSTEKALEKALPLLASWKRIGLVTTVQHVDTLDEAKDALLKSGKVVSVGDAGRLKHAGQVIGCDYRNAIAVRKDVDAFVFLGGGRFHALGVELATSKPTVVADLYEQRAYLIGAEVQRIRKQRWASIQKARQSLHFGVLIGLRIGQQRMEAALLIRDILAKAGKRTTMLTVRELMPDVLMEFPSIDAYVNTACPRISLDDAAKFQKPVLTVKEALVVAGKLKWEQLLKKGWFED
jgi:2-(3-amino-3-carboxypropyl)histidine synthase